MTQIFQAGLTGFYIHKGHEGVIMKWQSYFLCCVILITLVSCVKKQQHYSLDSKTTHTTAISTTSQNQLYGPILAPIEETLPVELYVEKLNPIHPGATIDVINIASKPPKTILSYLILQHIKWKVNDPYEIPTFPAPGFVRVMLTKDQYFKIHNKDITIKLSK